MGRDRTVKRFDWSETARAYSAFIPAVRGLSSSRESRSEIAKTRGNRPAVTPRGTRISVHAAGLWIKMRLWVFPKFEYLSGTRSVVDSITRNKTLTCNRFGKAAMVSRRRWEMYTVFFFFFRCYVNRSLLKSKKWDRIFSACESCDLSYCITIYTKPLMRCIEAVVFRSK